MKPARATRIIPSMTSVSELNKRKVRLFVEAIWNQGHLELIDELVAADHLGHISCLHEPIIGPNGVRRLVTNHRHAYPDLYIKIDDQIAEDDLVATRWRATATTPQTSRYPGRSRSWTGISLTRLLAGRQVDTYSTVASTETDAPSSRAGRATSDSAAPDELWQPEPPPLPGSTTPAPARVRPLVNRTG